MQHLYIFRVATVVCFLICVPPPYPLQQEADSDVYMSLPHFINSCTEPALNLTISIVIFFLSVIVVCFHNSNKHCTSH